MRGITGPSAIVRSAENPSIGFVVLPFPGVLDGRSARWAWRTDDGGDVVRGSYVLTRPLEARSTS